MEGLVGAIDADESECLAIGLVFCLYDIAEAARGVDCGGMAVAEEEVAAAVAVRGDAI